MAWVGWKNAMGLTPVKGAGVRIASAERVAGVVAADLRNINLSATRPAAIYIILRDEPMTLLVTH